VVHIDGAWGSVTPSGNIHMAMFSEHWPVPGETIISPDENGMVQDAATSIPDHILREIEIEVTMSRGTAKWLRDWLDVKLSQAQAMFADQEEPTVEE
jgi:hypothetical protein